MPSSATIVEIMGRKFDIPLDCPCCGAAPDTEIAVPLARGSRDRAGGSAVSVDFPYCRHCVAHAALWDSASVVLSGLIVLGLVVGGIVAAAVKPAIGLGVIAGMTAIAFVLATSRRTAARQACRESCGSVGNSVVYLGYSGTASGLAFESISYAAKFAERNASRLVDDARIRRLLEKYKLARIAVPTPAAAVAVIPPPLEVGEWITRLASTPTRVARRSTLVGALEMLAEPREREQLLRAVCAIEIAAYLAPLDKLQGAAAKERHLRTTIDQVRRDNIPDELQQMLLRELEQRISAL
jgi:hypothetical protein